MITIREFRPEDVPALHGIFFHTVRHVNSRDYSENQVCAWASDDFDLDEWSEGYHRLNPFVALWQEQQVVGYADVQETGFIDHFFCHWQYQGCGVGRQLMEAIHEKAQKQKNRRLFSHVSITAKPFFEHFGFSVIKEQKVNIRGQNLTNYVMEKVI